MQSAKRPGGRPRVREESSRSGAYIGFKTDDKLKRELETSARIAKRSLSAETRHRVEMTFRDSEILMAALDFTYGKRNAAAVLAFGRILLDQSRFAAFAGTDDWSADDNQFETVLRALRVALEGKEFLGHPSEEDGVQVGEPDKVLAERHATIALMDPKVRRMLDTEDAEIPASAEEIAAAGQRAALGDRSEAADLPQAMRAARSARRRKG